MCMHMQIHMTTYSVFSMSACFEGFGSDLLVVDLLNHLTLFISCHAFCLVRV